MPHFGCHGAAVILRSQFLPLQNYGILGCLREQYEDLSAACKEEVFKRQAEAANDWRTDRELNEACQVLTLPHSACIAVEHNHMAWLRDL